VASLRESDEKKLTEIFRDLFNNPGLILTDELTASHVPGWDSFNHINLVMMIEEEFDTRFSTTEIAQLANVGQFKELIASKIYQT
jgi:acyl carrier protein